MNPLHHFNQALRYIESHLDGEVDMAEAARQAACSPYHLSRTFSFLAGISLSDYIRRRRMTLAALDLAQGDLRVLDVAVKYGYTSADAFSRAFAGVHGVLPSQVRDAQLKSYPPMHFQLSIQGGEEMNYRIISKDAFRIIGIQRRVRLIYEGVNPEIAAMFHSLTEEQIALIKGLSDTHPKGLIQATTEFSESREEGSSIDHYIGAASHQPPPQGLSSLEVSACEWAIFPTQGPFPKTMQDTWARIYTEWFPTSGYQHAGGPELVWSAHRDVTAPDFRNEIWIPVKKLA